MIQWQRMRKKAVFEEGLTAVYRTPELALEEVECLKVDKQFIDNLEARDWEEFRRKGIDFKYLKGEWTVEVRTVRGTEIQKCPCWLVRGSADEVSPIGANDFARMFEVVP